MDGTSPETTLSTSIEKKTSSGWFPDALVLTNLGFLALVLGAIVRFGSMQSAFGYTKGETLSVSPASRSFGVAKYGDPIEVEFQVTNHDDLPARIVGAEIKCAMTMVEAPPFSLGPREKKSIHFKVHYSKGVTGEIKDEVRLFTNLSGQPFLPLMITGSLVDTH